MSYSKSEWLVALACGLAGAAASLGAAVYHMESVPPLPRFFIFCIGAIAAMPGAIVAGTFFEAAPAHTLIAVGLATSGLFWMWMCLRFFGRDHINREKNGSLCPGDSRVMKQ
jgi:hypothetical protein